MKPMYSVGLSLSVVALGMTACVQATGGTPLEGRERIGVYDSRAIAIAWAGTPSFNEWMGSLMADHAKAKAAGDDKRMRELEAEGVARQRRLHMQGFSTAPVDEIIGRIGDSLPGIRQRAAVSVLISKWDREALAKYPGAEQVDVTMALVDALHPNARQRQCALEAQKQEPIPLEKARSIKDW